MSHGSTVNRLLPAVLFLCAFAAAAAPPADLWPRWEAHDPVSGVQVDHGRFADFLDRYLDSSHSSGIHRVAYGSVTSEDRGLLDEYLRDLQAVKVSGLNRAEQKAYWINLYNGFTVKLILDNYPVKSILKISNGLIKSGPWNMKLLNVEGEDLALNDIEHRILRPIWKDNRIHYAVNCASLGCPNLQPEPYTSENTEALLDRAAREYVNHSRGVSFEGNQLKLSSIYNWYQADFGGSKETLIRDLQKFALGDLAVKLQGFDGRIKYSYDWNLNE